MADSSLQFHDNYLRHLAKNRGQTSITAAENELSRRFYGASHLIAERHHALAIVAAGNDRN